MNINKSAVNKERGPSEFRVGRLSFDAKHFIMICIAGLIFAQTAGVFLPIATASSNWVDMLLSHQSLTIVLLIALSAFILIGIRGGNRTDLRRQSTVIVLSFLTGSIEGVLFGGVTSFFKTLFGG